MQPWTWPLLTQQTPHTFGRVNELHPKLVKVQVTGTVLFIFSMLVYFHWFATFTNLPNIWTLICWPLLRHDYNISCNGWCSPQKKKKKKKSLPDLWSTVKLCLHCTSINVPDPFRYALIDNCNYYVKLLFHLDLLNHLWYWYTKSIGIKCLKRV